MKALLYFIILWGSGSFLCYAQDHRVLMYSFQNPKKQIVDVTHQLKNERNKKKRNYLLYQLAFCYYSINMDDNAFSYFSQAQKGFSELSDPISYDANLFLHKTMSYKKEAQIDTTYTYLKSFYRHALSKKSLIRMALSYHEFSKIYIKKKDVKNAIFYNTKAIDYSKKTDSIALYSGALINKGTIYNLLLVKPDSAMYYYKMAYNISKNTKDKEGALSALINIGYLFESENDFESALAYYRKADSVPKTLYPLVFQEILYFNFKSLYKKTKNEKLYTKYSIKYDSIENVLKENQQIANIAGVEINSNKKEISSLKNIAMRYQENKILYFILIGVVFLLAMYSFIRWKKVDMRRRRLAKEKESLQVEHTQTIEELEKVKQLVIEDHIVLKNKAKVYLNELIYIKAEDHYLQLFTSKKKEFVRGKISEIVNELPPNFVQTHRSYIVNKNLITSQNATSVFLEGKIEIPLSRNFKKNITN